MTTDLFARANPEVFLDDVDPWELYLFTALPMPLNFWFYRPEFDVLARDWLIQQLEPRSTRAQRAALYLRFGLATGGRMLSWEEVAEILPGDRSKQAARELGTKGLASLWRQYREGVPVNAKNKDILPECERVIADMTAVVHDMPEAASIAPPKRELWDPDYASGTLACGDCGLTTSFHQALQSEDEDADEGTNWFECPVCGGARTHRRVPTLTTEQLFPWRREAE